MLLEAARRLSEVLEGRVRMVLVATGTCIERIIERLPLGQMLRAATRRMVVGRVAGLGLSMLLFAAWRQKGLCVGAGGLGGAVLDLVAEMLLIAVR